MRLYNTLSRNVEDFSPISQDGVKLYTCGPTVYSYYHLGNLRNAVFNDTLRRTLEASNYIVKHVMNITDVGHLSSDQDEGEDKLEKGAAQENKTVWEVADFYIEAFKKDVRALNILEPNGYSGKNAVYPRATDFISQQLDIVKELLDKGFAYQTQQAIYFDVTKLSDYGKLTGQKLADKEVGARQEVVVDQHKKHPQDFALWFFKAGRFADHSMSWESPWGEGFPGWHLECSAIIHTTLGEPIDIHTGGVDHIGTHHTNEIAQTEAAFGVKLANYWLHNEHLLVGGRKMAKSAGNFYTLKDVSDKGYDPLALRLLFLQSHYRSQANFTWEALDAAQSFLLRLQAWADLKFQPSQDRPGSLAGKYQQALDKIKDSLQDDLNSSEALSILSSLATESDGQGFDSTNFQALLDELDALLGLNLAGRSDITADEKSLITQRQGAREAKDWTLADELRQKLERTHIAIKDTPAGQVWNRT